MILDIRMYGLTPERRITVGIRLHLRPGLYRPHPDLQNLPPQARTLRWWQNIVLKLHPSTPAAAETIDGIMVRRVTLPVSHMKRMSLRQNSSMRRLE